MKFEHVDYLGNFTVAMKEYTEEKLSKLNQVGTYKIVRTVLTVLPNKKFSLEISLDNKVRASARGEDFYTLVIECVEKLFSQITKYKKYLDKRHSDSKITLDPLLSMDDIPDVVREKTLIVEEMSREEAIANMEILGHTFFIFRDIDAQNNITVVYKRKDETYGSILCR